MGTRLNKFVGRRSPAEKAEYEELITRLQQRFPHLEPIAGPPPLVRVNGIGVAVFGRRNVDKATGTYVKTLAVTIVWIPVFMIRAYRVDDVFSGGWQFIGREPLSNLARSWNLLIATLVAIFIFTSRM